MSAPAGLGSVEARALRDQLATMRVELDQLKANQRASDLGLSSIDGGALLLKDRETGQVMGSYGRQDDGTFGFAAHNGPAPPRPDTAVVEAAMGGLTVRWNGTFVTARPRDFTYVTVHVSPAGEHFIPDDSNRVGNLLGAGKMPVTPLVAGQPYWVKLVAHNTSGVPSDPSFVAGPTIPAQVVAAAVLQGIVDTLGLADHAVTENKHALGSVTGTIIADDAVTSPKIAALSILAEHIVANAIQAGMIDADVITGREIQALSILAEHLSANSVTAGAIAAGSVTADKLEALLVLANLIIAGDPDDWHLELGDSTTPILFWDNTTTGFALSRDPDTGQSNIFLSGRVQFGNGSQIDNDYLDLIEQPTSGYQMPKVRQSRGWVQTEPVTNKITPVWVSATQPGNTLFIWVTAVGSSSIPSITAPSGWQQVATVSAGALTRMSLYQLSNAPSHAQEVFQANQPCEWSCSLLEYPGLVVASLDRSATAGGQSGTASSGSTAQTTQTGELQLVGYAVPRLGNGRSIGNPTGGFTKVVDNAGAATGLASAVASRTTSALGTAGATVALGDSGLVWVGIVATFKLAAAQAIPPTPADNTVRFFARDRGGVAAPWVIDPSGRSYPLARGPFCRVHLTKDVGMPQGVNVFAQGDWACSDGDNPYGMVAISSTTGTYSNVTIPLDGWYLVDLRAIYQLSSGGQANNVAALVLKGGIDQTVNPSVARDLRPYMINGEGSPVQATKMVPLKAGDILYWATWQSAGGSTQPTLYAQRFTEYTELSVFYWGPLS